MAVERGISAVVDAGLISAIVVIGLVIILGIALQNPAEFKYDEMNKRYAEYLTYSLLRSTVQMVWYNTSSGTIILEDKSVAELIAEDLYIREHNSSSVDIKSLEVGMEEPINRTLKNLTYPKYRYSLYAEYKNTTIIIGFRELPQIRYGYTAYLSMPTSGEEFIVTIYIWEVSE